VDIIKKRKKRTYQPRLRVNNWIRAPKVRVVFPDGDAEVMKTEDAIAKAKEFGLDLIEISPNTDPPVCKILDMGKYKYEQEKKLKESKKHQKNIVVKEMRFRPKTQEHDYQTKLGHIKKFLANKDKVKVNIFFKGREITHQDLGMAMVEKLKEDLAELGQPEYMPKLEGRNITVVFAPVSQK